MELFAKREVKVSPNFRKIFTYCHAKLPSAGLGNKLFVWARAYIFAQLNRMPLVVTGWTQPHLAPFLYGGGFRLYLNYFRSLRQVTALKRVIARRSAEVIQDPPVAVIEPPSQSTIYEFSAVSHWSDYFGDLKPYRDGIRDGILNSITSARRREYMFAPKPIVCVHIRLSDFRRLKEGENFAKVGNTRTPLSYFTRIICGIREIHGSEVPVMVISDGSPDQFRELLDMPNVSLGPRNSAIVDILMMASSKVLVTSAGSTFSYWGGFLGDCALIMHPDHIHQSLRPRWVNERFFEGAAVGTPRNWPELLQRNILTI